MTEHKQLTWAQIVGMVLMGVCLWTVIFGLIYAVVANGYQGLVIVVTGLVGMYVLHRWLIFINEPKE